jgi:hypothetical protein
MEKSKKKKTTQEDSQKDSPNEWWDDITITQEGIEAYISWMDNQTTTWSGEYED